MIKNVLDGATPRILLFYTAILFKIIASAFSAIGFVLTSAWFGVTGTVFWAGFLVLLLLIAAPETDLHLRGAIKWLRASAATIVVFFLGVGVALLVLVLIIGLGSFFSPGTEGALPDLLDSLSGVFGYNDATALSHQGSDNFIAGKNPYAESNIVSATIRFSGATDKLTPLREGVFADAFPYPDMDQLDAFWQQVRQTPDYIPQEIESRFNYPAGSFLVPAPFIWAGINDFRIIYAILLLPVLAFTLVKIPGRFRLYFVFALAASLELWNSMAAGETGFLYFPFLLLAWILYKKNLLFSALAIAVAVAIKQLAWFLVPFYLILLLRNRGPRSAALAVAVIGGVFVAANGYFIALDPNLWLNSIIAPVADDMFPLGVGIISLVQGGLLDIRTSLPFTIIEIGVFIASVTWYYLNCRRYPDTGLVLAFLPLFFAWRSLWGYFFYIDIILLASIMINEYGQTPGEMERASLRPRLQSKLQT